MDFPAGPPAGAMPTFDDPFAADPQAQLLAPSQQSSARLTPLNIQASQQDRLPSIGPIPSAEPRHDLADASFENTQRNFEAAEEVKENPAENALFENTYAGPQQQTTMLPGHAGEVLKTQEEIMDNLGDIHKRTEEIEKMFADTKVESKFFAYDASKTQSVTLADPDLIAINAEQYKMLSEKSKRKQERSHLH